jgi:hypothetical protein
MLISNHWPDNVLFYNDLDRQRVQRQQFNYKETIPAMLILGHKLGIARSLVLG